MKIYNYVCAFFYQILFKLKSSDIVFFTYFLDSCLIVLNLFIIVDFYTYFFLKETILHREIIIGIVFLLNGIFFYFKADYKQIKLSHKGIFLLYLYLVVSFILMMCLLKLHHDRNI